VPKGKSASEPRKRNVPFDRAGEDCQRRFHKRWSRPFTDEDARRLREDFGDGELTVREARGALMFLAQRDGGAMATGNSADAATPMRDGDLAVLLVLLGFLERKGSSVGELIERERATFAKLRKKYEQLRAALSAGNVSAAFDLWAEHGFAAATGPAMLARLAADGKLDAAQGVLDDLKALALKRRRRLS
jgi:hypothetical protein